MMTNDVNSHFFKTVELPKVASEYLESSKIQTNGSNWLKYGLK